MKKELTIQKYTIFHIFIIGKSLLHLIKQDGASSTPCWTKAINKYIKKTRNESVERIEPRRCKTQFK